LGNLNKPKSQNSVDSGNQENIRSIKPNPNPQNFTKQEKIQGTSFKLNYKGNISKTSSYRLKTEENGLTDKRINYIDGVPRLVSFPHHLYSLR